MRWQYQTESQTQAGLVPTKSGLLFGCDTHGNLLVFNAKNGKLLKSIDTGGALNSGLISYSVDGEQYVAAAVGGATENPSTVAGPLRISIYGLRGNNKPRVVTLDRLEPSTACFEETRYGLKTAEKRDLFTRELVRLCALCGMPRQQERSCYGHSRNPRPNESWRHFLVNGTGFDGLEQWMTEGAPCPSH